MKKIEDYRKKYIGFYNKFRLVVNQYGCYPNNLEFDINNEDDSFKMIFILLLSSLACFITIIGIPFAFLLVIVEVAWCIRHIYKF